MQRPERLEGLIHVRMTRKQEGALRRAARRQGMTISEYIRQATSTAAQEIAA
ncbi:plasmid mobilization protein [Manganibacter manganicus]|uniref:plasmid mobilization protein n=1 Tax=Manganibacter manganicus TaxID=1873176 RepID=UPI0013019F30|nr:DUF1778 domain-containing protein [Pseudaminobacter manganicus]